ncbi:MAG: DUF6166 domain-containing protein [Limisphaerales bacterium]
MKTYHGSRTADGTSEVWVSDGAKKYPLPLRLDLRNHSPTGFAWGYGGAGPVQLALALMADACGDEAAQGNYQDYKWAIIAGLPASWTLTEAAIRRFVEQRRSDS